MADRQIRDSVLSVLGEVLITLSAVIGSYVIYELQISNFYSHREWDSSAKVLQEEFKTPAKNIAFEGEVVAQIPADRPVSSKPFALMSVPKLWKESVAVPIFSGTSSKALAKGLGHISGSALPGQLGNFAVSGHRATYGEPFAKFELLREGDEVIVDTVEGVFTYSLVADIKVTPEDVWVVEPRPAIRELQSLPPEAQLITLITCDPRWSSEKRWIWFGTLKSFVPRTEIS